MPNVKYNPSRNIFRKHGPIRIEERIAGFNEIVSQINAHSKSSSIKLLVRESVVDSSGRKGVLPKYVDRQVSHL